jgi:hypothetical protein
LLLKVFIIVTEVQGKRAVLSVTDKVVAYLLTLFCKLDAVVVANIFSMLINSFRQGLSEFSSKFLFWIAWMAPFRCTPIGQAPCLTCQQ